MIAALEKAINEFDRDPNQTKTSSTVINGKKYFIKVCGAVRGQYKDNEVDSLECLSKISAFYADYFVGSITRSSKTAILLQFIEGTDMYDMIRTRTKWEINFLVKLYKLLLSKVRVFHDHLLTHGDIKATNFYIHSRADSSELMDIDLIDTESVNNFNPDHRKKGVKTKFINFISNNYDFPVKLRRGHIQFSSHKNAFLFYKFLDLYAVSVLILFMYKPKVYLMIKNKGEKDNAWKVDNRQRHPTEFVKAGKNNLERALQYVFSFLTYVEKTGNPVEISDIPISHRRILELLEEE